MRKPIALLLLVLLLVMSACTPAPAGESADPEQPAVPAAAVAGEG